ncbi:hypothetical protein EDM57_04825 [Brevibacillus gelatini]|uniref:Uncharacterized protein n=1 Tax=Brevibacillus gelatini TaxID=1655277 RepID=A0A3M8B7R7_9BACL|nr:hypothetical protein [Brevibacillus gelatini]RNB59468.1 hypothetical protein EDM57_04825 [Brevibacillus gelatini]
MLRNYEGKDNYGRPKSEYLEKLSNMDYESLLKETEDKIWLSAYAANNPRSDYHWQVDACYDEWSKRGDVKGYEKAYKNVVSG